MTQFYCLNCACLREFVPGARYWLCVVCDTPGPVLERVHAGTLREDLV